jgi:aminodeoxyfutalosine deaminase
MEGPVLEDGAVAVAQGRILAVGTAYQVLREVPHEIVDHGDGALLPALVNAHCHLEFSALRGCIPPQPDLGSWLAAAMAGFAGLSQEEILRGVELGLAELRRFGTALVAEVSNTGLSLPFLARSPLEFHYFYECLGFHLDQTGPLEADFEVFAGEAARGLANFSAAAHAPYSVSEALFHRVRGWNRGYGRPTAVHLAESLQEIQFLQEGRGFFQELLGRLDRWRPDYQPPGLSPAAYLDRLQFLGPDTLAAHGVWLDRHDLEILARRRTWVALCPRSNRHTGAGFPNLPELRRAGVRLALGTDSLAGNEDLNLFRELLLLHERYPETPLAELLALATLNGARALGREQDFGSLAPGKQAALLFIPFKEGGDFWEALLQAGARGNISWAAAPGMGGLRWKKSSAWDAFTTSTCCPFITPWTGAMCPTASTSSAAPRWNSTPGSSGATWTRAPSPRWSMAAISGTTCSCRSCPSAPRATWGASLFFSRTPFTRLSGREVLLSRASATSAALVRILLYELYGARPRYRTGPVANGFPDGCHGLLAIGDEALRLRAAGTYPYFLDLGRAWHELTGLPFVFGVWAARREISRHRAGEVRFLHRTLLAAKAWGVGALPEICRQAKKSLNTDRRGSFELFSAVAV